MKLTAPRIYAFILLSCVALLAYALYAEKYLGLAPCPLCMTQRLFYGLTGAVALVALLHRPARIGRYIYAGLLILSNALGAAVAGRQVWLQHLPEDQVPACGPSLGYMLDTMPLGETVRTMMMGDGNCAEVVWTFLGLSMPEWSLIGFTGLGLAALLPLRVR